MVSRFILITASWVVILSFCPSLAEANLIPIALTGEITHVGDINNLEGRISVGDMITGVYIYDSSTPDSDPAKYAGLYKYNTAPYGVMLTVGGFVFMTDPRNVDFVLTIGNDLPLAGPTEDRYGFTSISNLPLSNGVSVDRISLSIVGPYGRTLSSDELPTSAPILTDWWISYDSINIRGYGDTPFVLYTRLTSVALIPEPATFVLLGLAGLTLLRKRTFAEQNGKNDAGLIRQARSKKL
jgi:hypothetical protein